MSAEKPEYIADSAEVTFREKRKAPVLQFVATALVLGDISAAYRLRRRPWQEVEVPEEERDEAKLQHMRADILTDHDKQAVARADQQAQRAARTPEDDLRVAQARAKRARKAAARRCAL